jgi:GTP-binding protein HflX
LKTFFHQTSRRKLRQNAILAGVHKKSERAAFEAGTLDELASLCRTAGANVVGRITQVMDRFNPATLIGSGKVEELSRMIEDRSADLVVFDTTLAPSQQVNLEKRLSKQVIDRPALILDIFAIHAKTREARAQVELAQMQYILPRLAGGWTHLERQEGAIGTRGPGETQLETDRRLVRKRISDLKKQLVEIEGERHEQRKGRKDLFNVCLVGYTNAGKSTIFNRITGENVVAENYLFATLDSTTRKVKLPRRDLMLLSDTVGFIRKLPVSLVASFKSTLLEASEADLLLHVISISDDDFEDKIETVMETLNDIGCSAIPTIPLFNKIDLKNDPDLYVRLLRRYPGAHFVSGVTGEGVSTLLASIENHLERSRVTIKTLIDASDSQGYGLISSLAYILDSITRDGRVELKARMPKARLGKLARAGIEFRLVENGRENEK